MTAAALLARIDAMVAECDKATPGPWRPDRNAVLLDNGTMTRWWIANTNTIRGAVGYHASPIAEAETEAGLAPRHEDMEPDAAFIAASRAGWPATLRALRVAVVALPPDSPALAEIARLLEVTT